MTRVVGGIYDDVELDTGFFLTDNETDVVIGWLDSYADALEKTWVKKGSEGNPKAQKFAKVRSFKAAVLLRRGNTGAAGDVSAEKQG